MKEGKRAPKKKGKKKYEEGRERKLIGSIIQQTQVSTVQHAREQEGDK